MATVIVASGQPLELAALCEIVRAAGHRVAGEAANGPRTLQLVRDARPDLLVLAIDLAKMNGLEVLRRVKARGASTKTLLFGEETATHFIQRCYDEGADGFVGKHEDPGELQRAMEGVLTGHRYFPSFERASGFSRKPADAENPLALLSARELTVLGLLARGVPNIAIARELSISEETVSAHRSHLRRKLNAASLVDLVDIARQYGILNKPDTEQPATPTVPPREIASLRAMLDGTPLSLHVRDREGRLVACNAAFLALHESTFEALVGTHFDALDGFAPETARMLQTRYLERVQTGQPLSLERCELERHGRRALLHVWATPWRGDDGALLGMVCGTLDVTGREDMLKALALERDAASAVLAGTNRLMLALCDELESVAALLRKVESGEGGAAGNALVHEAGAAAKRIERFTRGVTDLLTIEASRPGFMAERVAPLVLAREVVEALRPECEARGGALTMRVSGEAGAELRLDRASFERVVHLLLGQQIACCAGCAIDISLDLAEAGASLYRFSLAIETRPREVVAQPGADAALATPLAQAGGHLALTLCRRYVELMHGTLEWGGAAAPTRVAMVLLLSAY